MAKMRMTSKKKREIEQRMLERALSDEHHRQHSRRCAGQKSYHIRECPEREEAKHIIDLFSLLESKYSKDSEEFVSIEEYFKAKKNILAFCQRELIELENKRCK